MIFYLFFFQVGFLSVESSWLTVICFYGRL